MLKYQNIGILIKRNSKSYLFVGFCEHRKSLRARDAHATNLRIKKYYTVKSYYANIKRYVNQRQFGAFDVTLSLN